MYSNIPTTDEPISIILSMCSEQALDKAITSEFIKITHTILEQNYFEFHNQYYVQTIGLAMGASTSAILSEIYLHHLEHTRITNILV
jgi:hypothetical protein